jgi:hypothetical protein
MFSRLILPVRVGGNAFSRCSNKVKSVRLFSVKDERAARRGKVLTQNQGKGVFGFTGIAILSTTAAVGYAIYDISNNPTGTLGSIYKDSALDKAIKWVYAQTFEQVFKPSSDKLLPDWGSLPFYEGVPPGQPCPPLVVIDLEKTLIGSTYDSKHGWRHVKRPGLDKLLRDLGPYYEIVIFSENDIGAATDIFMAIDPENRCHKFGSNAGELRGHTILKRLDLMNRDLSKIILIDDDPAAAALFPRNTLYVKPYDIDDKNDTVLIDLVPLLQAFVHEEVRDVRDAIDNLGTHEAEEAAIEYQMRLSKKKKEDAMRKHQGLGRLIRGSYKGDLEMGEDVFIQSSVLSPSQIVGGVSGGDLDHPMLASTKPSGHIDPKTGKVVVRPQGTKKKGALFSYLDQMDKEQEEENRTRMEEMNRIHMERQMRKNQGGN